MVGRQNARRATASGKENTGEKIFIGLGHKKERRGKNTEMLTSAGQLNIMPSIGVKLMQREKRSEKQSGTNRCVLYGDIKTKTRLRSTISGTTWERQ